MIWIPQRHDHQAHSVCVLNLQTWRLHSLSGLGKESVRRFVASDEIVALITHGHVCYAWDLQGVEMKTFRVPNHNYFGAVTCRGRTIACATADNEVLKVFIWDFDTQHGQAFESSDHPGLQSSSLEMR